LPEHDLAAVTGGPLCAFRSRHDLARYLAPLPRQQGLFVNPLTLQRDRSQMRRLAVISLVYRHFIVRGWITRLDYLPYARPAGGALARASCRKAKVMSHAMKRVATALAFALILAFGTQAASAQTLKAVQDRGQLVCGANGTLAGFGMPDPQGNWVGFDVDFCRAIAAAIFNDPTKVKFVPLTAANRITSLQTGEIDVLSRNTTWTMSRDTSLGIDFADVNYYDGQGFMVRKSLKVNSALELNDASVCVQQGTTTELNLADYFRSNNMTLKTVTFATADEAVKAYDTSRCDSYTTDSSGLYGERLRLTDPSANIVLPEIISKEPLSPAVRQGDDAWEDIVRWTHYAMVNAEELGVTQKNVDDMMKSDNPDIRRLLGVEGKFGSGMGLTDDWAVHIIKAVGNYGESFERNVGQGSPLKIARGLNALWTKGGLQYGIPVR
jgi:general L-amino acid transport system substrate-binding protein